MVAPHMQYFLSRYPHRCFAAGVVTVARLCCEYSTSTPGENDEHDRELWLPVYFAANKPSYEHYGRQPHTLLQGWRPVPRALGWPSAMYSM